MNLSLVKKARYKIQVSWLWLSPGTTGYTETSWLVSFINCKYGGSLNFKIRIRHSPLELFSKCCQILLHPVARCSLHFGVTCANSAHHWLKTYNHRSFQEDCFPKKSSLGAWSLGLSVKIWLSFGVCSKCHFPGEITLKIKHGPRSLMPPFASRSWEIYLRISSGLQGRKGGGSAASGCWSSRSQAPTLPFPCLPFHFEGILSVWARQQLSQSLGWPSTSFFSLLSLMPLCLVK